MLESLLETLSTGTHREAERRSCAASLRLLSDVSTDCSALWRVWTMSCCCAMRVRGCSSIDISWVMIESVSRPDAMPLI